MKKNIWMVLAAASLMTACDYNEKYFEGFDETDQRKLSKKQKVPRMLLFHGSPRNIIPVTMVRLLL